LRLVRLFPALPKTAEAQILGRQLRRAGTSVGANYREAYRARSKPELSPSAAIRCANWKRLLTGLSLKDAGIVAADQLDSLARKCDEPTAIFVTTLKMSKETPS
jgi:four helix bundle protein